VTLKTELAVV